jgi:hypothetical protein
MDNDKTTAHALDVIQHVEQSALEKWGVGRDASKQ